MRTFWQDLAYGVRTLFKAPGFTAIALLTIALGVGANTAIFSVVNAVLLRPLPFDRQEQLVQLWGTNPKKGVDSNPLSYLTFTDLRAQNHSFESMTAYTQGSAALVSDDSAEQIEGVTASAAMFPMLGINPVLGRTFNPEDEKPGKTNVVVISDGLWRRRFGADRDVIGQVIKLGGDEVTIVGVLPAGVKFPLVADNLEFWTPLDPTLNYNQERGANYLNVAARLKPGVSPAQGQSEMDALAQGLARQYPDKSGGRGLRLASLHEAYVGNLRPALLLLWGAVLCVLLIGCANVANLLLGRAVGRHKEIAVRLALGATRRRLVRQLLTESVVLAGAGGLLGLILALWGMDLLSAWVPPNISRVREISLDMRVLAFTAGISLLTGLIFGIAPALSASKLDINDSLKESGRGSTEGGGRSRLRGALVIGEIALSLVLLVSAGLLIKSFNNLLHVAPGFRPEQTITMSLSLPETKYKDEASQARFFQQALRLASEIPGVDSVGAIDPLPLSNNMVQNIFSIEGSPAASPEDRLITSTRVASEDYLKAMGIPLIKGRGFTARDGKDAPKVFLINETLAKKHFAGEDPLGKRLKLSILPDYTGEIVGVVGDVKHRNLESEAGPECYVSFLQAPTNSMSLVVSTAGRDPVSVVAPIREAVTALDKDIPMADVQTMSELVNESIAARRFNMLLLTLFATLALVLAAVGIFGVISYSVTQRTHEVGIRIALGAQTGNVLRLIIGQGMVFVVAGVGVGLIGALAATRVMSSLLYGVGATDPFVFIGVAFLLGFVALLACLIPAVRATRVDPLIALRYE